MAKRASALARLARTALDLAGLSLALWLAFLLRFDWRLDSETVQQAALMWPLVVALQCALLMRFKVPRFNWSLFGLPEATALGSALGTAVLPLLAIRYGFAWLPPDFPGRILLLPSSVVLIDAAVAFLALTGLRSLRRLQRERIDLLGHQRGRKHQPAIVIGAGRAGHRLVKELRQRPDLGFLPVAFVDDKPDLRGQIINGIPVLGATSEIEAIAKQKKAGIALIAIASANGEAIRRMLARCEESGLKTKIVPTLDEVISGRIAISQVRDVAIEDLLGREPVHFGDRTSAAVVHGKCVLVTGAGGSIGSELCRQILRDGPSRLVLLERAENNLYNIHRELVVHCPGDRLVPAVGDVTDPARMREVFETYRPDVVFHAAAHKHVPMMEANPNEAIKNNFLGTKKVADLADEYGVEGFVLISTDKAVNPTSVMGATKRLAELYVQDLQQRSRTRFVAVRFGNVLGSSGSVIPLFKEQIARGGPVTVTHPEMTRYFMTIPEACKLVIEAAGLGERGAVMVLDMGEPVRILDLAEQMVRLSGLRVGVDIDIEYCGIRPGEKLFEELALDLEKVDSTRSSKVFVWRSQVTPSLPVEEITATLSALKGEVAGTIRATLARVLPDYSPQRLDANTSSRPLERRLVQSSSRESGTGSKPRGAKGRHRGASLPD